MSKQEDESKRTSRRQFTKAAVTAAVAAPIVASIASCSDKGERVDVATNRPTPTTGPQMSSCDSGPSFEDHIPPMGFDGGGSLRIELKNKFEMPTNTNPPFVYVEKNGLANNRRYGQLEGVRIISELTYTQQNQSHLSDVTYSNLPQDAQLLIWYQRITGDNDPTNDDDPDGEFDPPPSSGYPANNPDFRLIGGRSGHFMNITVRRKQLMANFERTHKKGRPFRFKQQAESGEAGMRRHFRIGQWRIVGADGITAVEDAQHNKFEGSGAEEYRIYAFCGHYA